MAMSDCSGQVVWVRNLLAELGYNVSHIPLSGDNQGSIFIASNPVTEPRSKHIDIRFHFIRWIVEEGKIKLLYCPTDSQVADVLTKALPSTKAKHFASLFGLRLA